MASSNWLEETQWMAVDKYPLPNISDLLDQLGKCEYSTTLYLANVFHNIEINPSAIEKKNFIAENGHSEFHRMAFGFKGASSTFQRLRKSNLKIHPDKYKFLRKEFAYFLHIIIKKGAKPNPQKLMLY